MTPKKLMEEATLVRQAIIKAMPPGASIAAIIIALAQLIELYQRAALKEKDD